MEHKAFNWLGAIFALLYALVFCILIFLGIQMENVSKYFYSAATLWFFSMFAVIPLIFDRTWFLLLPEKTAQARIISKGAVPINWRTRGVLHSISKPILMFELIDGTRLAFPAKHKLYHTLLENEEGLLVYRGQGDRNYFVSFIRKASFPE